MFVALNRLLNEMPPAFSFLVCFNEVCMLHLYTRNNNNIEFLSFSISFACKTIVKVQHVCCNWYSVNPHHFFSLSAVCAIKQLGWPTLRQTSVYPAEGSFSRSDHSWEATTMLSPPKGSVLTLRDLRHEWHMAYLEHATHHKAVGAL